MNPLNWPGPDFLVLYIVLLFLATPVAFFLRWHLRQPSDEPAEKSLQLNSYEIAYLIGGPRQAVDAALASLVHRQLLQIDAGGRLRTAGNPLANATALEAAICKSAAAGAGIAALRATGAHTAERLRTELERLGLVLTSEQSWKVRLLPMVVVAPVVLLGIAKVIRGISIDRPVGYLLALLGVSTLILCFLVRKAIRSRRGDRALRQLKHRNSAIQYTSARNSNQFAAEDYALAVALFGAAALAGGPLNPLYAAMRPPSSGGSGCSSSSGCSGGGSCGGGCGGGGCGGCGS